MKAYLLNICALVLFSAVIDTILPEKWNKYIKIITALMVTAVIISPFSSFEVPSFEEFTYENKEFEEDGVKLQQEMIKNELEKRIEEDINQRLYDEYEVKVKAKVTVSVNQKDEITGVDLIRLSGSGLSEEIIKRINEIYSPSEVTVDEY